MAGGRPLKFQSVEELQSRIADYFAITPQDELTITGLALALDTCRETLMDYQDNKLEFSDTIKMAKLRIHQAYELDLRKKGRSGDIFALKNFGWKDTQDINTNLKMENSEASEELAAQLNALEKNALLKRTSEPSDGASSDVMGEEVRD